MNNKAFYGFLRAVEIMSASSYDSSVSRSKAIRMRPCSLTICPYLSVSITLYCSSTFRLLPKCRKEPRMSECCEHSKRITSSMRLCHPHKKMKTSRPYGCEERQKPIPKTAKFITSLFTTGECRKAVKFVLCFVAAIIVEAATIKGFSTMVLSPHLLSFRIYKCNVQKVPQQMLNVYFLQSKVRAAKSWYQKLRTAWIICRKARSLQMRN
jgi:hypothetical protein